MFMIGVDNRLAYGITLLAGGVLALGLGWYRSRRAGIAAGKLIVASVLLPLLIAFFSHLLYGLTDLENTLYMYSISYLFAFWESGTMVYGGVLGAMIALAVAGRRQGRKLMELFAPSGALMIAAARIAEGFSGQGYGEYAVEESFFCRPPFMMFDPDYEAWAWALFMLEALVALALLIALLRKKRSWDGDGTLLLLGLYASAQIVLESLRRDEFLRWGFVRVEELLSAITVVIVLACYCVKAGRGRALAKTLCFSLCLMMIVLCLLLEFATEGRIPFLEFLDVNACYIAMAGACAVMGASVLWMRRLCNAQYIAAGKECPV